MIEKADENEAPLRTAWSFMCSCSPWLSDCDKVIAGLFRADEAHGLSIVGIIQGIGAVSALVEDVAMLREECDRGVDPVG